MNRYDLCLAWNWEYDADFVTLLGEACRSRGLSVLEITPDNLLKRLRELEEYLVTFWAFLDRASDADFRFTSLVHWAHRHASFRVNPHEQARRSCSKATMHWELIEAGLYTPHTIILPSFEEEPNLPAIDLGPLKGRFVIKPSRGGGGDGVVTGASSLTEVHDARRAYPTERYLLQAEIFPAQLDCRSAWFRVLYCAGQVYPCWWDTNTHVYTPVSDAEKAALGLEPLWEVTATLARVSGLDLFSTEISLTVEGLFVVVDYVNDQLDLRLQSKAADGVPDAIVCDITNRLASLLETHRPSLRKEFSIFQQALSWVRRRISLRE